MTFFRPSQKVLETICDGELYSQYITIPLEGQSNKTLEEGLTSFLNGLLYQIASHYRWNKVGKRLDTEMNTQKIVIVWEAMTNAIAHGSKRKDPVTIGLFLGNKGACYGFKDSGDYFKRDEIKEIYENKQPIQNFGEAIEGLSGCHAGVNCYIFKNSDLIEVDTLEGVLYCVQLKSSLKVQ